MKDALGPEAVLRLACNLQLGIPTFDVARFVEIATRDLEQLELKARVAKVASALSEFLPKSFSRAVAGILRALPGWDQGPQNDSLRGFSSWPLFTFIEERGLQHPELALAALRDLTHLFTAEFSVRPFVQREPHLTLPIIAEWTQHPSEHVRRLASEGIRPRLPWAAHLATFVQDPSAVLAILEKLVDDESIYVRRSVANNLADISVDHPAQVISTGRRWLQRDSQARRWIVKRATRNLVKAGHPEALAMHGFTPSPLVRIQDFTVSPSQVVLDQPFELLFAIASGADEAQRLVVDYVVHHRKANGASRAKVFKMTELRLEPGQTVQLRKGHAFRDITTRVYYQGGHRIEIQVNGRCMAEAQGELKM